MLRDFRANFPEVVITGILADALYGNAAFMDGALSFFKSTQVVSQLHRNQKVIYRGKEITVKDCFERYLGSGIERALSVRGGSEQKVTLLSARLMVKAHRKKRFIVALKYEGESDYRYLVATEFSWRHQDIARLYSLRWLIEVFFEDRKLYEGWCNRALQQGDKGSMHGVILSVLCDHLLLMHPEQSARMKHKQPALTAGCLIEKLKAEALLDVVKHVVESESPRAKLEELAKTLEDYRPIRNSDKHMVGRDLGRQIPTASLKYKLPGYCTLVSQKT